MSFFLFILFSNSSGISKITNFLFKVVLHGRISNRGEFLHILNNVCPQVSPVRYKELSTFLHFIPNVRVTIITPSVSACVRKITDPSESRLLVSEPRSVGAEVSLRLRPGPASGGREVSPAQVCGTQRGTHRGDIKLEIGRLEPVVMTLTLIILRFEQKRCIFDGHEVES